MTEEEIKAIIRQELPQILQDGEMRNYILRSVTSYFAGRQETESRFDQILEELRRDREAQNRKWEEENCKWEEQNRKWEEQNRKWEEQNRKWEENQQEIKALGKRLDDSFEEIKKLSRKHDSTIGALGVRWGLASEQSFRNALKGILETSFGVEVVNIVEYDDGGEVFGRPDQIELDLLIKNGVLIICEIKSSMSKPDMYIFEKKVRFYQRRHQRQADRKLVISPMVAPKAVETAKDLGIEIYSYAEDVEFPNS
jgi:hypothetical protein